MLKKNLGKWNPTHIKIMHHDQMVFTQGMPVWSNIGNPEI